MQPILWSPQDSPPIDLRLNFGRGQPVSVAFRFIFGFLNCEKKSLTYPHFFYAQLFPADGIGISRHSYLSVSNIVIAVCFFSPFLRSQDEVYVLQPKLCVHCRTLISPSNIYTSLLREKFLLFERIFLKDGILYIWTILQLKWVN